LTSCEPGSFSRKTLLHGVNKQVNKQASKQATKLFLAERTASRYRSRAARNCFTAVICRPTLHRTSSDKTKFMSWVFYHVPLCIRQAISFTKSIKFNVIFHFKSAYGSETQISPPYLKPNATVSNLTSIQCFRTGHFPKDTCTTQQRAHCANTSE